MVDFRSDTVSVAECRDPWPRALHPNQVILRAVGHHDVASALQVDDPVGAPGILVEIHPDVCRIDSGCQEFSDNVISLRIVIPEMRREVPLHIRRGRRYPHGMRLPIINTSSVDNRGLEQALWIRTAHAVMLTQSRRSS